jgi:hypothetical protein
MPPPDRAAIRRNCALPRPRRDRRVRRPVVHRALRLDAVGRRRGAGKQAGAAKGRASADRDDDSSGRRTRRESLAASLDAQQLATAGSTNGVPTSDPEVWPLL